MSAKERIEGLTNAWYGYAIFAAIISVLQSGFGIFSLIITGISTLFSICVTYFIGRRLLARSSLTRSLLLVLSVLSTLGGAYFAFRYGTAFLSQWSFGLLFKLALTAGSLMMNVRSFRVLTDSSVKSYFR